ncbi:MAG: hypothetical protein DRP08_06515 [Candidatus Aenigmatarchaeota archaeon]|nr:MAG: hypothetical protein DRP08_06515 [Candidatus Aenigmarchaeota archaeon]
MYKLLLVIFGFLLWEEFLIVLIGHEYTSLLFLTQAIYCRIIYATDENTYVRIKILEPEVILCTIH